MCKTVEGLNGKAGAILDWSVAVARLAMIPVLLIGFWGWWNHEGRIDAASLALEVMAGNRHTSADQREHEKEEADRFLAIWQAIAEIHTAMAALPPDEFEKKVDDLADRMRRLEIDNARGG